jgi:hypothetical protein
MEAALDIFRLMMREEISPELRQMGFKGVQNALEGLPK